MRASHEPQQIGDQHKPVAGKSRLVVCRLLCMFDNDKLCWNVRGFQFQPQLISQSRLKRAKSRRSPGAAAPSMNQTCESSENSTITQPELSPYAVLSHLEAENIPIEFPRRWHVEGLA